jgi:hypothetical protein
MSSSFAAPQLNAAFSSLCSSRAGKFRLVAQPTGVLGQVVPQVRLCPYFSGLFVTGDCWCQQWREPAMAAQVFVCIVVVFVGSIMLMCVVWCCVHQLVQQPCWQVWAGGITTWRAWTGGTTGRCLMCVCFRVSAW